MRPVSIEQWERTRAMPSEEGAWKVAVAPMQLMAQWIRPEATGNTGSGSAHRRTPRPIRASAHNSCILPVAA